MVKIQRTSLMLMLIFLATSRATFSTEVNPRLVELDGYWAEVSRTVRDGDFDAYKAGYHDDAVFVSLKTSFPISQALNNWKQGFVDTKSGKIKANVQFRFASRVGDARTAHESGIFLNSSTDVGGKAKESYVYFDALLVKKGSWKMLMEYQKNEASKADWDGLK